jgi:uncharacterized OsmC-like protein/TusA-related sulfurtransferase
MSESLPGAHPHPDAVCDGGDLDCGSGLLLIIRNAMAPLPAGGVLEVRSRETSVKEDLPAWCRMVGHALLAATPGDGGSTSYFVRKKGEDEELARHTEAARSHEWKVRVRRQGAQAAKAFVRNHAFVVGQPASFDTEDAAPSALELLLAALAGCLAVGYQWRASRRGIDVRDLEVSLRARADNILVFLALEEAGHPGLAEIAGRVYVDADGEDEALAALWEETVLRSPVAQSLLRGVPVRLDFRRA